MWPQQRRLDGQRDVEGAAVVQSEDRHTVRRGWLLHAGRWRRAELYPLRGEPLLDGAFEFVVGRLAEAGTRRRAVRMGAVIAVVADDRWRRDDRRAQRTFRIAEGTRTGTRAVIRVTVRLTYRRNATVSVTRAIRDTVRRRHLRMGEP